MKKPGKLMKKTIAVITLLAIGILSIPFAVGAAVETPPTPVLEKAFLVKVTSGIAQDYIQLFWQVDNEEVGGFEIYRNGVFLKRINKKDAKTTVSGKQGFGIVDKKFNKNYERTFTYQIRSYKDDYLSDFSNVKSVEVKLEKVKASSVMSDEEYVWHPKDDDIAPNIPTGLTATWITSSSASLQWNHSYDDKFATISTFGKYFQRKKAEENVYYKILLNGTEKLDPIEGNKYTLSNLSSNTTFNVSVVAFDRMKNRSGQSENITITTKIPREVPKKITLREGVLKLGGKLQNIIKIDGIKEQSKRLFQGSAVQNTITKLPTANGAIKDYLKQVSAKLSF